MLRKPSGSCAQISNRQAQTIAARYPMTVGHPAQAGESRGSKNDDQSVYVRSSWLET